MWNLIRSALKAQAGITCWLEAIDRYHLNERLGKVLRVIEDDPETRKSQLHQWNEEFDLDDLTIERIEERINSEMERRENDDLTELKNNATFINNNKDRMRYVSLRKVGLPVGSGVTEGACRYVVGERTKRASRRWHDEGLTAVLAVRSIYCSERLPRFIERLQSLYTADIREADGVEFRAVS